MKIARDGTDEYFDRIGEEDEDSEKVVTEMMQGFSFVSIDFETANEQRGSACQVGMTKVIGGELVESTGWYIIPPTGLDSFSPRNIWIHGITPEQAARGYTWDETVEAIADFAGELPLVAYNAPFDKSVYEKSCINAEVLPFEHEWHCALALSKRLLPDGPSKLVEVAEHLGIETPNHHDAQHDAAVAATIVTVFAHRTKANDLPSLWPARVPSRGRAKRPGATPDEAWFDRAGKARKDDIPTPNPDADPSHPLHGQHFVMTGQLTTMERWEAWVLAAQYGAQPQKTVTKKTTMVVVALLNEMPDDYDPLNGNGTERKAGERLSKGQTVQFVAGSEFLTMLNGASTAEGLP